MKRYLILVSLIIGNCPLLSPKGSIANDTSMEFRRVDPNQVPDELAMLAVVTKANYEKIKTWQGKILFEITRISRGAYAADILKRHAGVALAKDPNEFAQIVEGTIEYKIDVKNNYLFRYLNRPTPTEYIDIDKGTIYQALSKSLEDRVIITSEYRIESCPNHKKKDGTITGRIAKKQVHNQSFIYADDSDPRHCFNIGTPAWVVLSQLSENLRLYQQGTVNSTFIVVLEKAQTAKGAVYRVRMTSPTGSSPWVDERFVLDGEKGFNPTYIEVKNDKGIKVSEITTDFIEIQGIFLPSKRRVVQYDDSDGRMRRDAQWAFSDMQVNMPLPENTFSLNNLGLHDGDSYVDEITKKKYLYKDGGNLVEVNK